MLLEQNQFIFIDMSPKWVSFWLSIEVHTLSLRVVRRIFQHPYYHCSCESIYQIKMSLLIVYNYKNYLLFSKNHPQTVCSSLFYLFLQFQLLHRCHFSLNASNIWSLRHYNYVTLSNNFNCLTFLATYVTRVAFPDPLIPCIPMIQIVRKTSKIYLEFSKWL